MIWLSFIFLIWLFRSDARIFSAINFDYLADYCWFWSVVIYFTLPFAGFIPFWLWTVISLSSTTIFEFSNSRFGSWKISYCPQRKWLLLITHWFVISKRWIDFAKIMFIFIFDLLFHQFFLFFTLKIAVIFGNLIESKLAAFICLFSLIVLPFFLFTDHWYFS